MIDVTPLRLPGLATVETRRFGDARGFFTESYNAQRFADAGIAAAFCQDNHSYSAPLHTLRGLHYQAPPFAQAKLVRVLRGAILDVAVDARKGSPTFGQWESVELSAANGLQLFVPRGFLHGFLTLVPDTEIAYKVDAYYDAASDGGVAWNDPDLAIDWGLGDAAPVLSDKDAAAPAWADFATPFDYNGGEAG